MKDRCGCEIRDEEMTLDYWKSHKAGPSTPAPQGEITMDSLLKYWDGLEAIALRKYHDTNDSKYLSEALTIRLHLRGLGGDPDTKHLHAQLARERESRKQAEAALQEIADLKGRTLIGHPREDGASYSAGANAAFERCAGIALDALPVQEPAERERGK